MGGRNKYSRVLPGVPKRIISGTAITNRVMQLSAQCFVPLLR